MPKSVKKPHAVADLESNMVRLVHARGEISRVALARELKLVASTAGIYADRLIRGGYMVESKPMARGLGRPPVLIKLNPRKGRFIGVDFDARQIMTVAVDFAQQPLEQYCRSIPARATTERVLGMIEESIREIIGPGGDDVLGIGLGVPGPVDAGRGIARSYQFIPDWRDVPVKARIAAAFGFPVFVENNLRSMALAELWCGEGRGLRDLVCLGIRSGIGTGIIVGGKLLHGANDLAGEIGRWACPEDVVPAAGASPEGPIRTIEDVASVTAMLAEAGARSAADRTGKAGKPGGLPTLEQLLAAATAGDPPARAIVERSASLHGWIAHQLALLLDPERIIIAGPLVEANVYLDALERATLRLGGPKLGARVVRSTLGAFAGAIGAAALAFHHWSPRR
jgi:predicted NBD/HSP70 family sugar kinase